MPILEILSPFLSAGIGLLGAAAQRKHERQMAVIQKDILIAENAHELEVTKLHMQAKAQETEQELSIIHEQGAVDAFEAAMNAEAALSNIEYGKSKLGDFANFTRAMIRPMLTLSLSVATSIRAFTYFDEKQDLQLAVQDLTSNPFDLALINFTGLAIAFWFGSRQSAGSKGYNDGTYSRVTR